MSKNKYRVHIDVAADAKMYEHIRFLARVSVPAANRLCAAQRESIDSLEENPMRCSLYVPLKIIDAELRCKLCGTRYRIVFEVIGNDVYVYDIQDCRQDTGKSLV